MAIKTIFLVLLGAALVLAHPKIEENIKVESKTVVNEVVDRNIEDLWKKIESKFSQAVEQIKTTWGKIKEEGKEILKKIDFKAIKEKGLELLKKAKELVKEILVEGKEVTPEVKEIKKSLESLASELKKDGSEALSEGKKLVEEVVQEVKDKLNEIDQEADEKVKVKVEVKSKNE